MASDRQGPTIGEVVSLVRGNTYKSALLGLDGPILLGLGTIQRNGGFRADSLKTYGGESAEKILLRPGDLYVSLKDVTQSADLLGAVARVPDFVPLGRLTQDTVKLDFTGGPYPRALFYWTLRTPQYRAFCRDYATGTTNLGLAREDFLGFRLPVPSHETLSLVELLEALETRIDLLSQTNVTLEAIAQALFKSWFVDFDPVRAKSEGREPEGMDAATADLFPSEFEDSELGPIPKGWRRVSFGDVATLSKGSVNPMATPAQEFLHYSLPAFDAGQLPLTELGESIKSNKTPVPSDAVLVSKLNPHIPRIWFVGDTSPHAVCSTEFLVWTPKPGVGSAFIYTLAASTAFNSAMRQLVTGTSNSHQRVKPDQLAEVQAATISDAVLAQFDAIAAPMLQQVVHNRRRAAALAEARDTLLPRLISGKLRLT